MAGAGGCAAGEGVEEEEERPARPRKELDEEEGLAKEEADQGGNVAGRAEEEGGEGEVPRVDAWNGGADPAIQDLVQGLEGVRGRSRPSS